MHVLRYAFAPVIRCTGVSLETTARIVQELARRGYNAEREAVTLLGGASDPERAIERAVEMAPDDALVLSAEHVKNALENPPLSADSVSNSDVNTESEQFHSLADDDPSISTGTRPPKSHEDGGESPVETKGSGQGIARSSRVESAPGEVGQVVEAERTRESSTAETGRDREVDSRERNVEVSGDIQSTGTGEYRDFVSVFRDRYEKLAAKLRRRVNHRPAGTISDMSSGSETAIIGMVTDINSTKNGHWRIELEDTSGTFPCLVLKDREFAAEAQELLTDEVVAVEGTVSSGSGDAILFVDELYFPDVPRTNSRSRADRPVEAALISDVHVGSQEFVADAWERFADWLHTEEAERIEYLLIAGDMVEGVGVYPNQDEELSIVDIYEQYERFAEHLKAVPGDLEIVMIPGNHDAVRLAEPQPGFDEELRGIMAAHDARITGNPSVVTIEGVSVLMYHGTSFDEVNAELPESKASYDAIERTMTQLLKKRHVAPQYGGRTRIAPEESDYLVIDEVPDVFHAGHVHKLGVGEYHGVRIVNSACWQAQTDFQRSVNIDPDVAYAVVLDLDTLSVTARSFS